MRSTSVSGEVSGASCGEPSASRPRLTRAAVAALLLLGVIAGLSTLIAPDMRSASAGSDRCGAPATVTALATPLPQTAQRLAKGHDLTIVALGSSSTYGAGATSPRYAYPSRLAALLQARFPGTRVRVINRGVGGELGVGTAARIARDVLPEKPDLVIWQVGTNDVLHDLPPAAIMAAVRAGIREIRRAGADVILMDVQYAPAVLRHASYHDMEHALRVTARATGTPLFHRFALMRDWSEQGHMKMSTMIGRDHLHMTDASYDCLARQLGASIMRRARVAGGMRAVKG